MAYIFYLLILCILFYNFFLCTLHNNNNKFNESCNCVEGRLLFNMFAFRKICF